jgi:hypothetical protein
VLLGLFVAWRLYRRFSRMVGRQRLRPLRSWISVVLFPLFALALLAGTVAQPWRALLELAGVGAGVALALWGLKLTHFEVTPGGLFYTPSAHIGIALSLLLAGRLLMRFLPLLGGGALALASAQGFSRSPWTLLIFGSFAGYYAAYAIGLLRWRARVQTPEARP